MSLSGPVNATLRIDLRALPHLRLCTPDRTPLPPGESGGDSGDGSGGAVFSAEAPPEADEGSDVEDATPRLSRPAGAARDPAVAEAFALAQSGVPGPVFIECPVDLLYDEASVRQWYADAAGKGTSLPDRALRWYLNRHAQGMFEGSQTSTPAVNSS